MEYQTAIKIPAHNMILCGKSVSDMIAPGMHVWQDGTVKGQFYYVTGFRGFNASKKEEQEGYFFPFMLTRRGKKMTFIKNGKVVKENIDYDAYIVFRVTAKDVFEAKVDGKAVVKFDFSRARFDEKKGEHKMNATFYDTGVCGIPMTGHIGRVTKDSAAESAAVTLENELPEGVRLVNAIVVASDDAAGGTTADVGDGGTETAYVSAGAIEAGKATVTDLKLVEPKSNKVTVKLAAGLTAGTVDVFMTVIRMTV